MQRSASFSLRAGVARLGVVLGKVNGNVLEHREIETIKPYHDILAFVTMVVPAPRRREYNITSVHVELLALNSGEAPFALDDKAKGKRTMTMSRCGLTRVNELETSIQRVGGLRSLCYFANVSKVPFNDVIIQNLLSLGLINISTRRSASSAPMRSPDSIRAGRIF